MCASQAMSGLAETGVTDLPTWRALLGSDLRPIKGPAAPGPAAPTPPAADLAADPPPIAQTGWDSLFGDTPTRFDSLVCLLS